MWGLINKMELGQDVRADVVLRDRVTHEKVTQLSEVFNSYFTSIPHLLYSAIDGTSSVGEVCDGISISQNSFYLQSCNQVEICSIISQMNGSSASDNNETSPRILKLCSREIVESLPHVCNLSFSQGIFPSNCKTGVVTLLHKKGDRSDIQNYRPISILSTFSKVFEKLYHKKLIPFLQHFDLIPRSQHDQAQI